MTAQNDENQSKAQPNWSRVGGWVRIAAVGRNPKTTLLRIIVLVATCVVVFKLILLPIKVEGISMLPTYKDHSFNFVNRLAYVLHEPRRGDVVGIRPGKANTGYRAPGVMFMKRVVGLPGETVTFSNGLALINGAALNEPYLKNPCDWNAAPVEVGANQYYLVGDNRTMPAENHEHGKVDRQQIVGKVIF